MFSSSQQLPAALAVLENCTTNTGRDVTYYMDQHEPILECYAVNAEGQKDQDDEPSVGVDPPIETIDQRGDILLHVSPAGDEAMERLRTGSKGDVIFRVDAKTLARNSPVFDRMFFGGFAESQSLGHGNEERIVYTYNDDVPTLRLLLHVMHGRVAKVPLAYSKERLNLQVIFKIAVWADKYDCVPTLKPWIAGWVDCLHLDRYTGSDIRTLLRAAWITWMFGDRDRYRAVNQMAFSKILSWSVEEVEVFAVAGDPELPHFRGTYTYPLLKHMLDVLNYTSETFVKLRCSLLLEIFNYLGSYATMSSTVLCTTRGYKLDATNKKAAKHCEAMMYGEFVQKLHEVGIWPLPDGLDYVHAINDLGSLATGEGIKSHMPFIVGGFAHSKCSMAHESLAVRAKLDALLKKGIVLTDMEECHFRRQRVILGFDGPTSFDCSFSACPGHWPHAGSKADLEDF